MHQYINTNCFFFFKSKGMSSVYRLKGRATQDQKQSGNVSVPRKHHTKETDEISTTCFKVFYMVNKNLRKYSINLILAGAYCAKKTTKNNQLESDKYKTTFAALKANPIATFFI